MTLAPATLEVVQGHFDERHLRSSTVNRIKAAFAQYERRMLLIRRRKWSEYMVSTIG